MAKALNRPLFTEADADYLRSVCPASEFEDRCRAALGLVAFHHERDVLRGQATDRAAYIARSERDLKALNFLLSQRWLDDDERVLRRLRQEVFVGLEQARKSPKRGGKYALPIAAIVVVNAFRECGLKVNTAKNGTVDVLQLICQRAGMNLSRSSYKAAILKVVNGLASSGER